jgi:hypothetical protein
MTVQIDREFADNDEARAEIGVAVRYLLKDANGSARGDMARDIIDLVQEVANGLQPARHPTPPDAREAKQPAMSGVTYKAYVIDAFQRDTDRWRANIRRLNGKKIRVAVPPSVLDEATTSADALTAETAVEFAKRTIDGGALI